MMLDTNRCPTAKISVASSQNITQLRSPVILEWLNANTQISIVPVALVVALLTPDTNQAVIPTEILFGSFTYYPNLAQLELHSSVETQKSNLLIYCNNFPLNVQL